MTDDRDEKLAIPPTKLLAIPDVLSAAGWVRKREWVSLTDDEIAEMMNFGQYKRIPQYVRDFVEAIDAKLKEKNYRGENDER